MEPVIYKLGNYSLQPRPRPSDPALHFVANWTSPIDPDNQEALTQPGEQDAFDLGQRIAGLYPTLMPNNTNEFAVWTADGARDVRGLLHRAYCVED